MTTDKWYWCLCSNCRSIMLWDGVICARCAIVLAEERGYKPDSKADAYRRMLRKVADVVAT